MSTTLDATVISGPVSKESDVDAPVSFPAKETEVVRKADKASRELFYGEGLSYAEQKAFRRRGFISMGVVVGGGVAMSAVALAATLGAVYGGVTGLALGTSIPPVLFAGGACGICFYIYGPRSGRVVCKNIFKEDCGCIERCQVKRSKREASPELEEVVTEQPKSESPSPEPESVDESSV